MYSFIIDTKAEYPTLKQYLTKEQLIILDKSVRHFIKGNIMLYCKKNEQTRGIDINQSMYIGLKGIYRPYGFELYMTKWYLGLLHNTNALIVSVKKAVSKSGKRLYADPYSHINYIDNNFVATPPYLAKYVAGEFVLYIKDILWSGDTCYVFIVLSNNLLKRCKVYGKDSNMYFIFSGDKIKLRYLTYL